MSSRKFSDIAFFSRLGVLLVLLSGMAFKVLGASTDIANQPLITMDDVRAKPNIMFILDSSGSMDSQFMPDDMSSTSRYGYRSSQCNGLAYNPNTTYFPPVDADGNAYSNASFSAAWTDGFAASSTIDLLTTGDSGTIGLSSSVTPGTGTKAFDINSSGSTLTATTFTTGTVIKLVSGSRSMTGTVASWTRISGSSGTLTVNVTAASGSSSSSSWTYYHGGPYYYTYSGTQPTMSWKYTGSSGAVDTSTTFYTECMTSTSSASAVFTKVNVTASSSDATNYANWYSYYRKRILLMRTAAGKAFSRLDTGYRVGFTVISDSGVTEGGNYFRDVRMFDTTQKTNFYSSLYSAPAGSYTPLRAALSKAGQYFAKKVSGQTYDPMEYSCQRNYAILSTDGYWNTNIETSTYGPLKLDNATSVGNQDVAESRPLFDGTATTTVRTRTKYFVGSVGSCSSSRYRLRTTPQTYNTTTSNWVDGTTTSSCVTGSTVVVNGLTAAALANTTTFGAESSNDVTTGGSSDSLADVAQYYYSTDLRNSTLSNCTSTTSGESRDVCSNSLPASGRDTATWQHMTTFTIGLGVSGTLAYDKNYLSQTSGSYVDLTSGAANWPTPYDGAGAVNIDDLWHAAVNGRGQYYSALSSEELGEAISGVLDTISQVEGSASSASTNTLELVSGNNNWVYQATYTTAKWFGDIKAYTIDGETAEISSTETWSAKTRLDSRTASDRAILFNKSGVLTDFTYGNLPAAFQGYFNNLCSQSIIASQCSSLSSSNLAIANSGSNLVSYLRGERTYEGSAYRSRDGLLGDIINSTPVFIAAPGFIYTDTGYAAFKTAQASRAGVIYAGANDGMLHAFDATSGVEKWAFIPTAVLPNLYKLADSSYATKHTYFVDGTVVVGDIYDGSQWRTILVGGLNAGGKGYYALDITSPDNPLLLWEFTDTNLGFSYGNPLIGKRADGTWVVALTSGYNNTSGDGKGHLFVLDAVTGNKVLDISTGVGSSSTPSGLGKINAWIADSSDNTMMRIYAGDLLGNLWRFDLDNLVEPHQGALLLAEFRSGTGDIQPITVQPRLKKVLSYPVVLIATGRYLGTTDVTDTTTQSVAAVKDPLANSGWGQVRSNSTMVAQTMTVGGSAISSTDYSVDWDIKNGWWFDLPISGERVVTSMALTGDTLYVGSAVPSGEACKSGGSSWLYTIDMLSGGGTGEYYSSDTLIVGLTLVTTVDGNQKLLIKDSQGKTTTKDAGPGGSSGTGASHRTSWRELVD